MAALAIVSLSGCAGLVSGANTTGNPSALSALGITNVQAASTASTSQIVWTTNVAADSAVDYGTSTSYGSSTQVDSAMVTSHQVTLSGLAAGTSYYYQVNSTDSKGNHGKNGGHTFKTSGLNISGTISPATGGSGATLALSGAASTTTTADSVGNYTFAGLANGTYTVVPSHAGFTFTPSSQSTTVNGANITGVNFTDTAQTFGISGTISPTAGGSGATLTLSGAASATTTANSSGAYTFTGLASGVYAITPSNTGYTFTPVSQNATVSTVNVTGVNFTDNAAPVAPTITTQPANQTVTAGQTASFSVAAAGTAPLSYQWQKNSVIIPGATSSSYTTPATATSDSGSTFRVVVSNTAGTATSAAATLTVTAAPVAPSITTQPASQTVMAGQTASFSVAATGTAPLSYQWQKNSVTIPGATSSSYTTPATATSDSGSTFRVVVSNTAGSATSNAAALTVSATPVAPSITAQPASQSVTAGQTASFSVAATGTAPLSYQWQKNSVIIPGATSSSYTTPATTTSDSGSTFRVVVSNIAGTATSAAATLTVGQPNGQWITGYYAAQNGAQSPSNIPWNKYTHIIHFAAGPGVDATGNGDGTVTLLWLTQAEINAVIAARPAGKKVLVSLKDNDFHTSAFAQNTSPAIIATFVSNIVNFVNTNGYDGVDLDWEGNTNVTQYVDLLARLRNAMPTKVITMASGNWGGLPSVGGASYSQLDQINVMCYDMDSPAIGYSFYNDALLQAGNPSLNTCDWRVRAISNAGVPASKIGVGIPFYGRRWPGVTQALVTGSFTTSTVFYRNLATDATRWQPQYQFYDSVYKADYLSIPGLTEFDSYTGTQFIGDAVAWGRAKGFGGFMTFATDHEYLSSQIGDSRYPLSTALCQDVFGTCP